MDYKIGDKVVYPNHGVGLVEQISYGVLNGRTERYFMIRIVSSGLRVMVPQSNAETVGLRSVIRSTESTKVLGFLEKGKLNSCLLYTSPSPRDGLLSRMPSSA